MLLHPSRDQVLILHAHVGIFVRLLIVNQHPVLLARTATLRMRLRQQPVKLAHSLPPASVARQDRRTQRHHCAVSVIDVREEVLARSRATHPQRVRMWACLSRCPASGMYLSLLGTHLLSDSRMALEKRQRFHRPRRLRSIKLEIFSL